ncbi:hypothetical protein [Sanguibacter suaedae]|uniref:SAF domain-containing protein n=1 Tax=Sanguibacter suaedae TaxID=2795737 RepID=A0A934MAQ7_9MICO|nr:hypothetical protein [Sanguibacter suaedae]MBI9116038.1 hypothetical protein [Sanguibacter suaedae]
MSDVRPSPAGLPAPTAPRLRRPGWRDPRLAFGILLVAGSVALGSWAVTSAGRTVSVYAVSRTVTPGETLDASDLVAVDVRIGDDASRYLSPSADLADDLVVLRTVGDGELLPAAAVGTADALGTRSVTVPVDQAISSEVRPGALVDLWIVPPGASTTAPVDPAAGLPVPVELASDLVVAEVRESGGGGLMVNGAPTVHVLVPDEDLATVLAALSSDGSVVILPVPGGDA